MHCKDCLHRCTATKCISPVWGKATSAVGKSATLLTLSSSHLSPFTLSTGAEFWQFTRSTRFQEAPACPKVITPWNLCLKAAVWPAWYSCLGAPCLFQFTVYVFTSNQTPSVAWRKRCAKMSSSPANTPSAILLVFALIFWYALFTPFRCPFIDSLLLH